MSPKSRFVAVIAAAVVVAIVAVGGYTLFRPAPPSAGEVTLPVDPAPLVVFTEGGERNFTVEIADDPAERQQGLMFREDMADDHGMLFVFGETQLVGFWMKDTPLALDLIFIGQDGRVRAVRRGEPEAEVIRKALRKELESERPRPRGGLFAGAEPIADRVDELLSGFGAA